MKVSNMTVEQFLALKPEYIGTVAGVRFFEHPEHGDDAPLVAVTRQGKLVADSGHWELPDSMEVLEMVWNS